jgi:hypothetical protein
MQLSTSTKSVLMPSFPFERRHGTRDSQLVIRTYFLRLIAERAPRVVDDLWPTFWELVFEVCKEFGKDLIDDEATSRSGSGDAVDRLLARAWKEHRLFIINSEPENWKWRTLYWPLEYIHRLDEEKVREAFTSWELLADSTLRKSLRRWSEKWNLDSYWCREHAFVVLRRCLFNKGLQESLVHPHNPGPNPFFHPPKAQTIRWDKPEGPTPGKPNNWLTSIWTSTALEALQDGWETEYWRERWHDSVVAFARHS